MYDNVLGLCPAMVTYKQYIAGEEGIVSKPSMDCLTGEVSVWFQRQLDHTVGTKESAANAGVIVYMDVVSQLTVGGSATKDAMSFWDNGLVRVKHCFQSDGTWMILGVWFI